MLDRLINGYKAIYKPDSKYSFKNSVHEGFVYEHHLVLEQNGIEVPSGYDVHHLDGDKLNNNIDNLIVLSHSDHTKLHNWLNSNGIDLNKTQKKKKKRFCKHCGKELKKSQMNFCDNSCQGWYYSKMPDPVEVLESKSKDLQEKYSVSGTTVTRWRKKSKEILKKP